MSRQNPILPQPLSTNAADDEFYQQYKSAKVWSAMAMALTTVATVATAIVAYLQYSRISEQLISADRNRATTEFYEKLDALCLDIRAAAPSFISLNGDIFVDSSLNIISEEGMVRKSQDLINSTYDFYLSYDKLSLWLAGNNYDPYSDIVNNIGPRASLVKDYLLKIGRNVENIRYYWAVNAIRSVEACDNSQEYIKAWIKSEPIPQYSEGRIIFVFSERIDEINLKATYKLMKVSH